VINSPSIFRSKLRPDRTQSQPENADKNVGANISNSSFSMRSI